MDEWFTRKQFNRFLDIVQMLKKEGKNPGMLHCSESTAMLKHPIMNLNAVRLGSILQGRTLVPVQDLKKIGQVKTSIQEIKTVPKGYNISYGKMFKTKRETKIAIIPMGYMDGFCMRKDRDIFSLKENVKSVGIEIKKFFKYPVIGRIGMYHAVVDITNAEDITVASEVTLDIPPMQVNSMIRREYF